MRQLLERLAKLRVLVIGDLALDHYIWGETTRLAPEAPVALVDVERDSYTAGMAAIPALNLAAWGIEVELCGVVGKDDMGQRLVDILGERSIGYDTRFVSDHAATIVKTRVMAGSQLVSRFDREDEPEAYAQEWRSRFSLALEKTSETDAVILSDYSKGVIDEEFIEVLRKDCRKSGAFIALDPKPRRRLEFAGLDLMTPNRHESLELAGMEFDRFQSFPAAEVCSRIWDRYRPGLLVITLGAEGMLISRGGEVRKRIPSFARDVFDVSGAGDTSIAGLTAAMAAGALVDEAVHFANTAAGVVVGKLGVATASPGEILDFHDSHR